MSTHDYEAVRKDIVAQLKKPDYDDGSAGPVFVRLAWYVKKISHRQPFRPPVGISCNATDTVPQALLRHI